MSSDNDKTQTHVILTKGTMVSHYRIIEKIGAGGMGEVYLAEDTKLNRKVALKFLPPHLCQDENCHKRFTREAQAAAKLSHPNIITIHEVGDYQGQPFFAMEHVEGQTLRDLLKDKRLDLDRVVELSIQICEGLNKAHQSGVTHRDIKPSNIVIDPDGHPRLLDFGLATVSGAEHLTRTGTTLGTAGYMSPEQVRGKPTDDRSDLFSFGVVLYEMIAGMAPFRRESEAATMHALLEDCVEKLSEHRDDVPNDLAEIVNRLMEKDRNQRYQKAEDVLSDLKILYSTGHTSISAPKIRRRLRLAYRTIGLAVIAVVAVWGGFQIANRVSLSSHSERIMLAVLPFDNLGESGDEYVADGISEEIRVSLSRLSDLGVISRSSALKYKSTDKEFSQIGLELGVDYILQGTVQWDKSGDIVRLRINPALIRLSDNINIWADQYTTVLDDLFAIQVNVAENVTRALNVALLDTERQDIATRPTDNAEAYDFYLRGNQYFDRTENGLRQAEAMYLRALELDENFALVWAKLGLVHTDMYWYYCDRSPERLASAKEAIDRSLAISPDLGEGHFALGWYYYHGYYDYDRALEQFALARLKQPNNSELIGAVAWVQRRQGRWQEAVVNFRNVIELNPRHAWVTSELAGTLTCLRQYDEAERYYDRAIDLAPDLRGAYFQKSLMRFVRDGDTRGARQVIADALEKNDRWPSLSYLEVTYDNADGDYQRALSHLTGPGSAGVLPMIDTAEYFSLKGDIYRYSGSELSRPYYDSARVILERKIREEPEEPIYQMYLGRVYAGLGLKEDAIRTGEQMMTLCPLSKDAMLASDLIGVMAEIYAMAGEDDLALDQIDQLLSIPSWSSVAYIKASSEFAFLHDHPRFKVLIEKYEKEHGS